MIVNYDQIAAITNTTTPSTTPLASIAGALPRNSSAIASLRSKGAVAPSLQHDDACTAATTPTARHEARDACLEPAAERRQREIEHADDGGQDEQLARADHTGPL